MDAIKIGWYDPFNHAEVDQLITDLPTSSDFEQAGIGFLNHAWETAIRFLLDLDDYKFATGEGHPEDEVEDGFDQTEFWNSARSSLITSTALVQQGIELLLKARIAEVSVYLLISGDPSGWPKGSDSKDVPFADFRTIDASDLIRSHNIVCSTRLPDDFMQKFDESRRLRNSIFHTVDTRIQVTAEAVLLMVLYASDVLIGSRKWFPLRTSHVHDSTDVYPIDDDLTYLLINRELKKVIELLKPADLDRFTGFKKKERRYICSSCERTCGKYSVKADCAQLVPKGPSATFVHCYACSLDTKVIRKRCKNDGCKSNVLAAEDEVCLICFEGQ